MNATFVLRFFKASSGPYVPDLPYKRLNLTGALMWWGPNFAFYGAKASYGNRPGAKAITQADISYKFGIVMTLAGLLGVPGGSYVAQTLRQRYLGRTFNRRS